MRNALYDGIGYPHCSRELVRFSRKGRDPNGFYARLGLDPDCRDEDISRAYRRIAKTCHPDSPTPNLSLFLKVKRAYEVLTTRRYEYDSLPEGTFFKEEDDVREGIPIKLTKVEVESDFSFFYEPPLEESDLELASRWYRGLQKTLPGFNYRGRLVLRLGKTFGIGPRGMIFVPRREPCQTLLFLLGLQVSSLDFF